MSAIAVATEATKQSGSVNSIVLGASPSNIPNNTDSNMLVTMGGGTVSLVTLALDGITFLSTGLTGGAWVLPPGAILKVAYIILPAFVCTVKF